MAVLIHHLGAIQIVQPSSGPVFAYTWYKLWINGAFGVTSFFVVSGFVITRLLAGNPQGLFAPDFRDFYVRRFGRIIPLWILTCSLGLFLMVSQHSSTPAYQEFLHRPESSQSPLFWASIATFTLYWYKHLLPGMDVRAGLHWDLLWSLSVEETFYLFYPLLLRKLSNRNNLLGLLVSLVFFPPVYNAINIFYFPKVHIPILGDLEPFGSIAAGCLLYLFYERFTSYLSGHPGAAFFLFLTGAVLFTRTYFHQDYKADFGEHIIRFSLISWGTFLMILGGLHLSFLGSDLFRPMQWIGTLSYGGYLYHVLILYFLWDLLSGKNEFLALGISVLAVFSVAYLSFRFFEEPVNHWIRRNFGRRTG